MKTKTFKVIPLTLEEESLLAEHELVISQGLNAFVSTGLALVEIRDKKLYRAEHKTFEAYCEKKWGIGRAHGYRLIEAAEVVEKLSPDRRQIVENEWQARALAMVPPHLRNEVVESLRDSGEAITEQSVTKAVNKLLEDKRQQAKDREASGEPEDDEEEMGSEDDTGDEPEETSTERTLGRVAKQTEKERLYLARGLEHLRLAVKDLSKTQPCDFETPEPIQATRDGLDRADEVFSRVRSLIAQAEAEAA